MNQNQNTDNTAGAVAQERLVRPSITPEQRSEFRQWSAAIEMLSDADKESEAGAWIASALGILGKTNVESIHPEPKPKDPHRFCRGGGGNNFHCGCKYDS